jgi:hypothetical protein
MTGFQTAVNITQAPAVEGDIASVNPRRAAPSAAGGWTAGSGGVTIGRFAWGDLTSTDSVLVNNAVSGVPNAIVAREEQALITTYLSESGLVIPQGYSVGSAYSGGDFWVKNTGSATSAVGNKAYAKLADGTIIFDATGQVGSHSGYVETKWYAWTIGAQNELVKISDTPIG